MIKSDSSQVPVLSDVLMAVLVCPRDQGDLEQYADELVCRTCGQRYRIENGVPNLLIEDE